MSTELTMRVIARIHTDFDSKFGIPRQGVLVEGLTSTVVFEPEYRDENALRGLEQFSHVWLIWEFSENAGKGWSPTVRPPRLGGNERLGVFATRSPFRPNPIGLSCARLVGVERTADSGMVLRLGGTDLMDGTPILDIKPYIPYADSFPDASAGFTQAALEHRLEVNIPTELLQKVPADKRKALMGVLEQDPRPSYQADSERIYGISFSGMDIRFKVDGKILLVIDVIYKHREKV